MATGLRARSAPCPDTVRSSSPAPPAGAGLVGNKEQKRAVGLFLVFVKSHPCWSEPSSSAFQGGFCACQEIIIGLSTAVKELGGSHSLFFCAGTELGNSPPRAPAPCLLGQRGLWTATSNSSGRVSNGAMPYSVPQKPGLGL